MPIYAYRCEACGFAKDVLQKISDAKLTECPSCGKSTFKKQVTAAGFQLKGTGWYATDFRGSGSAPTRRRQLPLASRRLRPNLLRVHTGGRHDHTAGSLSALSARDRPLCGRGFHERERCVNILLPVY